MDNHILIRTADTEIHINGRSQSYSSSGEIGTALAPAALVWSAPQWLKILADGTRVSASDPRTDHVAVLNQATGLIYCVESLGDPANDDGPMPQEGCIERCKQFELLGFTDWQLATHAEATPLVDVTRRNPAIDTNLFSRIKPALHWTSTAVVGSSASAWGVHFGHGGVYYYPRSLNGFALAVRRAGQ